MNFLSTQELETLRNFDTPTICNAIEAFGVRARTEGFTSPGLKLQVSNGNKPMVG